MYEHEEEIDTFNSEDTHNKGRNAINSICLDVTSTVNSSFNKSHFVDLSGLFSLYIYII